MLPIPSISYLKQFYSQDRNLIILVWHFIKVVHVKRAYNNTGDNSSGVIMTYKKSLQFNYRESRERQRHEAGRVGPNKHNINNLWR